MLGAVLLTGYLGGAVATHVRVGNPLFTPRPVSHLRRGAPLGRPDAARRAAARVPAWRDSEAVMSQVRSKDGTPIAYERSGSGPALDSRRWRALQPRLRPVAEARAAARAALHRLRLRPPRARTERRHAAVCAGARGRGHRRAHRGGGRVGVSSRAVVGRSAGARSRGQRASRRQGGRLRAALRGRQRPARRRRARGSAQASARGRQPRRRGEVLHEGHGRRAGADGRR